MKKNEKELPDKEETAEKKSTGTDTEESKDTAKESRADADDAAAKKRRSLCAKIIGFVVIVGIAIGFAAFDINLATVGHDFFIRIFNIATSTSEEQTDEVAYTTTPLEETEEPSQTEEATASPEATEEMEE